MDKMESSVSRDPKLAGLELVLEPEWGEVVGAQQCIRENKGKTR